MTSQEHPAAEPAKALPPAAKTNIEFTRDVQPIFEKNCSKCHGPEKQKSGLRLDRRGSLLMGGESGEPAMAPGDSANSHLVKLVSGLEPSPPAERVKLIRRLYLVMHSLPPTPLGSSDSSRTKILIPGNS